ncbi:very short patch repair endonuclease [Ideonella sp.]|uniref:very short patch repair endonuclease n=1 Tax=Ideonella sp. TaxID=1929293 RepID=UPI0035B49E2D
MSSSPSLLSASATPNPRRAALMRAVRRENTAPELALRRQLHAAGLRFRLHSDSLPGRPDIVLPRRGTVVFVHGCFWHGHDCPHGRVRAKTNSRFWADKIDANRARDRRQRSELIQRGWHVEVVWECQVKDRGVIASLVRKLLSR